MAAAVLAGTLVVSGCASEENPADPLQVAATLEPARPAVSPARTAAPEGVVLPLGRATSVAVVGDLVAVAVAEPPSVLLYPSSPADPATAAPVTAVLPGPAERLVAADGSVEATVPSAGAVVTVRPDGSTSSRPVTGGPVDVARLGDRELVARRDAGQVSVRDGSGGEHVVGGISSPDRLVVAGDAAVVLDRPRSAVFDLDPTAERPGAGLRAGDGATNAVADRFGRVFVVDTRGGELMAFSTSPLIMRMRHPLPGAPYGMAYDAERDLLWVTLTARNEVVALDVAGGEPVERHRYAAVRQPDSVAVDPASGRVFVASGDGQGMQVIG
ncbi:YncE family protein [Saccharothrix sp. Mg75]|uniref:YncE family protein n=1 Tax=Saccharothrix sp. Mg75 TaxID=3445357 RepID=UPI003EEB1FDB